MALNPMTKKLRLLDTFENQQVISSTLTGWSDKIAFQTVEYGKKMKLRLFYSDNYLSDDPHFSDISPTNRYSSFSVMAYSDSLIQFSAYDSLMKANVIWFAKPKLQTSIIDNIEENKSIYLSEPLPNPATDLVTIRFYWDSSLNIESADFQIFDILGVEINNKSELIFERINSYSGVIKWFISNVPTGIYFIRARIGDSYFTRSVIISR
jgi:hypothetical protein